MASLQVLGWPSLVTVKHSMDLVECPEERTARVTVLATTRPEMPCRNLFTLVRHRRLAMVGPWFDKPDGTWSCADLEDGLCLFSTDTSFQQCQAMVDQILASNTLKIDGHEVRYEINPNPRRHRAYRDDRSPFKQHPGPDSPILSPFAKHSAAVHEYWSFPAEQDRQRWRGLLETLREKRPDTIAHLGLPLDRLSSRLGNLMVAGAEDAISCDLTFHPGNRTLHFQVDTGELIPGQYHATVWATHSRDNILRRKISIDTSHTILKLESDIDHIGFAVYRAVDGECIDSYEVYICKESIVNSEMLGQTLVFKDRRGHTYAKVTRSDFIEISSENLTENNEVKASDNKIRQKWLDFAQYESEILACHNDNFVRFKSNEFDQARMYFLNLLKQYKSTDLIYIADPYFLEVLRIRKLTDLYWRLFEKLFGWKVRILCAEQFDDKVRQKWSCFPSVLTSHITIRTFLYERRSNEKSKNTNKNHNSKEQIRYSSGFHDRYLITPDREILMTNSFSGWSADGVTFVTLPYGVYRAEAEQLWAYGCGSHEDLIITEL